MKQLAAILFALVAVVASKTINNITQKDIHKLFDLRPLIRDNEVNQNFSRIIGGLAARHGQFPYQAGLIITHRTHQTVCGGSILNPRRVLTAAHCVISPISVTVVVGSTTLFSGGQRIDTSQIVLHPDYDGFIGNDIAMLFLPRDIIFTDAVAPIALPSGDEINQDFVGLMSTASGFGLTFQGDTIRPNQYLSYVDLPVITNTECRLAFGNLVLDSHLCTSGVGNVGVCSSDSGGPLVLVNNNRLVLVGVTCFGSGNCESGNPSGFTRVTTFIDWINNLL